MVRLQFSTLKKKITFIRHSCNLHDIDTSFAKSAVKVTMRFTKLFKYIHAFYYFGLIYHIKNTNFYVIDQHKVVLIYKVN